MVDFPAAIEAEGHRLAMISAPAGGGIDPGSGGLPSASGGGTATPGLGRLRLPGQPQIVDRAGNGVEGRAKLRDILHVVEFFGVRGAVTQQTA